MLQRLNQFICLVKYHYKIQYQCYVSLCIHVYTAKLAENNLSCSENVMYDAVGSTMEMSIHNSMTCSKNVAYASTTETKKDDLKASPMGNVAVYDEISPRK